MDVELENEDIPDSLLHPRWKVQRTTPVTYSDLQQNPYDLARPENLKQSVEYNDTLNMYIIGNKNWRYLHYHTYYDDSRRI